MSESAQDIVKRREIRFQEPHPDAHQSRSALLLLQESEGIVELEAPEPCLLRLAYDVRHVTLEELEKALSEIGFHLDNSLLSKLRRTLWYYAEETQRANLGCTGDPNCNVRVFINRYQKLAHGCRDERPQHWRKYL